MKRLWLLILLTVLYPTADIRAADGICACYYDDLGYCEYFYDDGSGVPFSNDADCANYCDDTFGETVTSTDFAEDSNSERGIDVGADCDESYERAVATAAATDSSSDSSSSGTSTPTSRKLLTPVLSIDIPTVTFIDAIFSEKEGRKYISVNYLGDYIAGVYKYLLGFATTIAIVMVMVSGFQWAFGGHSAEAIGKAQGRIKNAVTGLVLLLCTYLILFTVNPNLIKLQFPELEVVKYVPISTENTGEDVASLNLSDCSSSGTNSVPYFCQRNYTDIYGADCEGSPTIKSSGCGPTSLAMVLSKYGINADPKSVAESFEAGGYRVCGSGTTYGAFVGSTVITNNNMIGEIISTGDHEAITAYLQNDEPIIISVGKSRFTNGGHFIVLTGVNEDGTFSINDPNSGIQSAEPDEIWGIIKFAVYVHKKN